MYWYLLLVVVIIILLSLTIWKITVDRNRPVVYGRVLFVVAAHTNSDSREASIITILDKLTDQEVVVIQSGDRPVNAKTYNIDNNTVKADFGKYQWATNELDLSGYDAVVFVNDSCLWSKPIDNFLHMMAKDNYKTELYGYNRSKEFKPHIQSMFRGFNKHGVLKFKDHMNMELDSIKTRQDLIDKFEVNGGMKYKSSKSLFHEDYKSRNMNKRISRLADPKSAYSLLKLKFIYQPVQDDGRQFSAEQYVEANPDLDHLTKEELLKHWQKVGQLENRPLFVGQQKVLHESVKNLFRDWDVVYDLLI